MGNFRKKERLIRDSDRESPPYLRNDESAHA
jgi:hypothetical protein